MKRYQVMLLLVTLGICTPVIPQQPLTVEWIYSDEGEHIADVHKFQWLKDNTLLMYNQRLPKIERTLEKLHPKTGQRQPLVDAAAAVASLQNLVGVTDTTAYLRWPLACNDQGTYAVYLYNWDIFVLDMAKSVFWQITRTEAHEKALRFSPDGQKLAFVRDNDLYVFDLALVRETRLTRDGSQTILNGYLSWVYWEEIFGRQDTGYWWSPDSRAIAFLRTNESMVGEMHFVDFKPQVPRVIRQRYPKAGTDNPLVHVGISEIDSPETVWMENNGRDYEYIARVKWLPNGQQVSVQTLNRSQTRLDMFMVERNTGNSRRVFSETDPGWVNINDDLYFLDDGKHFIWQSERSGYAHLYRFRIDGELVNPVTSGEWALRSSGGTFWLRQSVNHVDQRGNWVYFTALKESSIERQLYRVRLDGSRLQQVTQESGVHKIYFSPDGRYYLDQFSDNHTLPRLALHDSNGKLRKVLDEPRMEDIRNFNLQFPDLFTIPTRDSFQMQAEILKPRDFDPNKKYPLIFYVYGGPSAPTVFNSWRGNSIFFDNLLLDAGYLVVRFDHRSSAAISKKLENRLNLLISGPRELEDVVDGIHWLKSQSYIDPERVGLWGWSGGGSFTLNCMTNTKEFKAGISGAPVTDWRYYDTRWAEFAMKRPVDNPEGYNKTSFVQSAKHLHGRLLLIHGTYDDNVHPQNSWAFIEELIQHNIQFDMMFYPMRKHSFKDDAALIHRSTRMLEFWKANL